MEKVFGYIFDKEKKNIIAQTMIYILMLFSMLLGLLVYECNINIDFNPICVFLSPSILSCLSKKFQFILWKGWHIFFSERKLSLQNTSIWWFLFRLIMFLLSIWIRWNVNDDDIFNFSFFINTKNIINHNDKEIIILNSFTCLSLFCSGFLKNFVYLTKRIKEHFPIKIYHIKRWFQRRKIYGCFMVTS